MTFRDNITFFDEATATGSKSYQNQKADSITLQVFGTFSAVSATVTAQTDIDAPFAPVALINLADYSVVKNGAITAAGRYAIGADGIRVLKVTLNSVSGGNVSIVGVATNTSEV